MVRHWITSHHAFQALALVSMRTQVELRDVAEQVVRTGELAPPGGRRRPG